MTTDLSYVVKQSPAAPKLPILPVPLEPNIINASVSAEVWHECPFQLGRTRKGTFQFPPKAAAPRSYPARQARWSGAAGARDLATGQNLCAEVLGDEKTPALLDH
jgi:hypothetical protein